MHPALGPEVDAALQLHTGRAWRPYGGLVLLAGRGPDGRLGWPDGLGLAYESTSFEDGNGDDPGPGVFEPYTRYWDDVQPGAGASFPAVEILAPVTLVGPHFGVALRVAFLDADGLVVPVTQGFAQVRVQREVAAGDFESYIVTVRPESPLVVLDAGLAQPAMFWKALSTTSQNSASLLQSPKIWTVWCTCRMCPGKTRPKKP